MNPNIKFLQRMHITIVGKQRKRLTSIRNNIKAFNINGQN